MGVRAKFSVVELKKTLFLGQTGKPSEVVVLQAAMGEGNKEWSRYTPSGRIEMQIDNPAAAEQFEIGKDYLVTFEPAPEEKRALPEADLHG